MTSLYLRLAILEEDLYCLTEQRRPMRVEALLRNTEEALTLPKITPEPKKPNTGLSHRALPVLVETAQVLSLRC